MMGRDYPLIDVLIATFLLVVSIWLVRVARVWILKRLERVSSFPERFSPGVESDLKSYIFHAVQTLTRLAAGAAIILLAYLRHAAPASPPLASERGNSSPPSEPKSPLSKSPL
jgi:hypothetical protein